MVRPRLLVDRPLTARECAEWMGFTSAWVRSAIHDGVEVQGQLVKLEAETLTINGRNTHRIHEDSFITFLTAIGWKRLPHRASPPPAPQQESV